MFTDLGHRLRSLLRRSTPALREGGRLTVGDISLDESQRGTWVAGRDIALSAREFALLECLIQNAGAVLSRDQILDRAWPFGAAVSPNTVDTYVHYLRSKLGPAGDQIETVWGTGYRLRREATRSARSQTA